MAEQMSIEQLGARLVAARVVLREAEAAAEAADDAWQASRKPGGNRWGGRGVDGFGDGDRALFERRAAAARLREQRLIEVQEARAAFEDAGGDVHSLEPAGSPLLDPDWGRSEPSDARIAENDLTEDNFDPSLNPPA